MEDYYDLMLITEYLAGRKESMEILIKRHLKSVYGFVYKYARNQQDAQDITQETFLKAWRNLKKFDKEKNFKTWLFTIAKNTALDFLKKKKTVPFVEFENEEGENVITETLADPAVSVYELLQKKDFAQTIKIAIAKLSPKYQAVLLPRYNNGLTFRDMAEAAGEPLHTIKSRYRRALIMLKKILVQF